jgi:hypothetical protein
MGVDGSGLEGVRVFYPSDMYFYDNMNLIAALCTLHRFNS